MKTNFNSSQLIHQNQVTKVITKNRSRSRSNCKTSDNKFDTSLKTNDAYCKTDFNNSRNSVKLDNKENEDNRYASKLRQNSNSSYISSSSSSYTSSVSCSRSNSNYNTKTATKKKVIRSRSSSKLCNKSNSLNRRSKYTTKNVKENNNRFTNNPNFEEKNREYYRRSQKALCIDKDKLSKVFSKDDACSPNYNKLLREEDLKLKFNNKDKARNKFIAKSHRKSFSSEKNKISSKNTHLKDSKDFKENNNKNENYDKFNNKSFREREANVKSLVNDDRDDINLQQIKNIRNMKIPLLILKNLPVTVSKEHLNEIFSYFGIVVKIHLKNSNNNNTSISNSSSITKTALIELQLKYSINKSKLNDQEDIIIAYKCMNEGEIDNNIITCEVVS
jgi:hypothetical protein